MSALRKIDIVPLADAGGPYRPGIGGTVGDMQAGIAARLANQTASHVATRWQVTEVPVAQRGVFAIGIGVTALLTGLATGTLMLAVLLA